MVDHPKFREAKERVKGQSHERLLQVEAPRQRHEELRNSIVYEDRTIAFIDLLGWKHLIRESMEDTELTKDLGIALYANQVMGDSARQMREIIPDHPHVRDLHITQFSDSVIVSQRTESLEDAHRPDRQFADTLSWLSFLLQKKGIFVRGAIVRGRLVHRESMVFGPALVEAYKAEVEQAHWPRVILSTQLAEEWPSMSMSEAASASSSRSRINWLRDADGKVFFDFLAPEMLTRHPRNPGYREYLCNYRDGIARRLRQNRDRAAVVDKYLWLIRYYNWTIGRFGLEFCAPLDIGELTS